MRLLIVVGVLMAIQLTAACSSFADEPIEKAAPAIQLAAHVEALQADEDSRAAMQKWQAVFEKTLQLYIDRLVSNFQLDEAQRKHLEIAAKGTVERYIKRWTRALAMRAILMEQEGEETVGLDPVFDADEIDEYAQAFAPESFVKWMTADPLWQRALEKTLDAESLQQLRDREREREASIRDRLADTALVWLDEQYLLSEVQRQKLRPLIYQEISKDLTIFSGHIYTQFYALVWAYQIPAEKMQLILSETQLKLWTKRAQEYSELITGTESETRKIVRWFDPDSLTPEQMAQFETK